MENTVIKVLTEEHGKKVIEWFKSQGVDTEGYCGNVNEERGGTAIYYGIINGEFGNYFMTNVLKNNAKIIELPTEEGFDMTTDEGRLAYAIKHYPVGTKYYNTEGGYRTVKKVQSFLNDGHIVGGNSDGLIYDGIANKWAKIDKSPDDIQKLSRVGLKEIHAIACSKWQNTLQEWGKTNPLEDYIELTKEQVNDMFSACTSGQLPIVSKYLKRDGSVDLTTLHLRDNHLISIRQSGEHKHKAFELNNDYDWSLGLDNEFRLCLIPNKRQ